jgi:hypothetical protein
MFKKSFEKSKNNQVTLPKAGLVRAGLITPCTFSPLWIKKLTWYWSYGIQKLKQVGSEFCAR